MAEFEPTRFFEFQLPQSEPFTSYHCEKDWIFGPLSLVNVFIGTNNSGKSRFLRSLSLNKELPYTTTNINAEEIYRLAIEFKTKVDEIFNGHPNLERLGAVNRGDFDSVSNYEPHFLSPNDPLNEALIKSIEHLKKANVSQWVGSVSFGSPNDVVRELQKIADETKIQLDEILNKVDSNFTKTKFTKYYIPVLRGMRPLDSSQSNFYSAQTISDYFGAVSEVERPRIFTGIELYQILKNKLLGEPEERATVRNFEDFLSKKFFQSRQVTLIPREGDNKVHIKIGNEPQLPIHQLGDGIQNLIICVFNIFMESNKRCLFFIEEPDIYMHPALQRIFIEILLDFPQHQYFITTHSNHLLDMTFDYSDISVFHFTKVTDTDKVEFNIRAAINKDQDVLIDLGVRNSSVFLSNATVWVEGITDRLYLRAYLTKYTEQQINENTNKADNLQTLKEDFHYSFVEYQGSTLEHWSFDANQSDLERINATFLCARAFLIADGDITLKGDREKTFKKMLGDNFFVLPVKEIENLIPDKILKIGLADKFKTHKKKLDNINYEDYAKMNVGLGSYLDRLLNLPDGKSVFAEKSGTIKSKLSRCEKFIKIMNDPAIEWDLTPDLNTLCEAIFVHILKENRITE